MTGGAWGIMSSTLINNTQFTLLLYQWFVLFFFF